MEDFGELIVDTREQTEVLAALARAGVPFARAALGTGDFLVRGRERQIVVERKTRADLKSSVRDGRYASQKAEMIAFAAAEEAAGTETVCVVVLEADATWYTSGDAEAAKIAAGAAASMVSSGFFSVVATESIAETIRFVDGLRRKVNRESPVSGKAARRRPKLAAAGALGAQNPFGHVPGLGPKALAEIKDRLAQMTFAEVLGMSRGELIERGISKRTATAIAKAAARTV